MSHSAESVSEKRSRRSGFISAVISALILSTTGVFIASLTRRFALPPLVLSFWREFFVFLILLIFLLLTHPESVRPVNQNFRFLIPYGFILAVFNGVWTFSVGLNGAAVGTVLVYTNPIFTALLGRLLLKERMTGLQWICIVLSIAGCVLVSECLTVPRESLNLQGILIGLLSGFFFAVYTLMGRRSGTSAGGGGTWSSLCWIFGIASVFMFLFNRLFLIIPFPGGVVAGSLFHLGGSVEGWTVLLMLAGLPTLLGYGFYNRSLRFLPSLTVSLIASSEPAFTAVLAFFILQERMSLPATAGSVLILCAVVLLQTGIPGRGSADSLTG